MNTRMKARVNAKMNARRLLQKIAKLDARINAKTARRETIEASCARCWLERSNRSAMNDATFVSPFELSRKYLQNTLPNELL